ncbi:unnamed protein product [Caenorhabditis auriculariae]|uniref:Uncharacterized protein n=1 Tax=Caenorhabditis auriculariae TaxID=2777116 RepID=A0A8S1GQC8_9PELO|nr:unnamed protein product [Caenorhabditis auriculariae]
MSQGGEMVFSSTSLTYFEFFLLLPLASARPYKVQCNDSQPAQRAVPICRPLFLLSFHLPPSSISCDIDICAVEVPACLASQTFCFDRALIEIQVSARDSKTMLRVFSHEELNRNANDEKKTLRLTSFKVLSKVDEREMEMGIWSDCSCPIIQCKELPVAPEAQQRLKYQPLVIYSADHVSGPVNYELHILDLSIQLAADNQEFSMKQKIRKIFVLSSFRPEIGTTLDDQLRKYEERTKKDQAPKGRMLLAPGTLANLGNPVKKVTPAKRGRPKKS